jgi:hypothetical protein
MSALRVPWSQRPKTSRVAKAGFIDPKLRLTVYERAGGKCECCGDMLKLSAYECHHRKLRSRGGQDSVCNLVALCGMCHRRLHSRVKFAEEHGFIVSQFADPATVPVLINLSESCYLTPNGKYRVVVDGVERAG